MMEKRMVIMTRTIMEDDNDGDGDGDGDGDDVDVDADDNNNDDDDVIAEHAGAKKASGCFVE